MSDTSTVVIKPLTEGAVSTIVDIHLRAFPSFFLSRMGAPVLNVFYRGFLNTDNVIALQAEKDGQVVGAAVGPINPEGFFAKLVRRNWFRFGLASLSFMARNPLEISRVLRALRYRGSDQRASGALLSSIAVAPSCQGHGVGRKLLEAWEISVRRHGCTAAYLTTDAVENARTLKFYHEAGWMSGDSFSTPEGRLMKILIRSFD